MDHLVPPQNSYTVLDADASQLGAIQAAVRGANLIIQGPPGTGKSQTIANIIAECIAAGRTVLFVSEKAAAIEVVHRRLTERGLGDFCLMLHSQKANKRDVIYDLGARMEPDPPAPGSQQEGLDLRRLLDARAQLNAYAEALHRARGPLGESAFWAHGEIARLQDVPYIATNPPSLVDLTHEQLDNWKQLLANVARHVPILSEGSSHPWAGIRSNELTLAEQESLRHALNSLRDALTEVRTEGRSLAQHLKLPEPDTAEDAQHLAQIAGEIPTDSELRSGWFDRKLIQQTEALAKEASTRASTIHERADRLFSKHSDAILSAATPAAIASYERGSLARLFSPTYRRFRSQVRSTALDSRQGAAAEELSNLRDAYEINQNLAWFREQKSALSTTLGLSLENSKLPNAGDCNRKASEVAAAAAILSRLPPGAASAEFVHEVCQQGVAIRIASSLRRVNDAADRMARGLGSLGTFLEAGALQCSSVPLAVAPFELVSRWLELRLSRFDDLDLWLRAQAALARANGAGLDQVIGQLISQGTPPMRWNDAFQRLVITHWLGQVYTEDEVLRTFRGDEHEEAIARFRDLDERYVGSSARRVRRALADRQVQISATHGGEPGLLRFEASKRRRHMPLRRLFERIPNLIPTLKPCLMMSPLSVAQFLPADHYRFDVVIFDEASQVRPHDAIGAIMRGKQLIVAGDSKQLPPTAFFDRSVDEGDVSEEQDLRALESILDGLRAKEMPSKQLLWHYRSRHEDLIAFSNHHFYERRLITFPTPAAGRSVVSL